MKRVLVSMILGCLAATVLQAAPAAAQTTNPTPAMGVQFHALWSDYTDEQRIALLDKMAAAGVKWVRVDVGWVTLESQGKGVYSQWYVDRLDRVVTAAQARGMNVLATFWGSPSWATADGVRSTPPSNPSDYASAAAWIVERFKGRIAAWEVWNEPNHSSFWTGTAAAYGNLLKVAYPSIKAADPATQVIFAGPSYNDDKWIAAAYDGGATGSFDVMSTHPYQGIADAPPETPDDGTKWTLSHVAAVRSLMVARGDSNKPIWFTEFGWSSHDNWSGISNWERGVTAEQQGDYLVRTLKYLAANHPYVTNVFWYNERNRTSGKIHLDNYGLLNNDLSEKPAYTAMKTFLTASVIEEPVLEEPVLEEPVLEEPAPLPATPVELLVNGGFESGLTGWSAIRSSLSTVTAAHSGTRAAKVVRKRDAYGIVSSEMQPSGKVNVTGNGFIKGSRLNQRIRLVVVEKIGGVLYDREVERVTLSKNWEAFPELNYTTSGAADSAVMVKVLSSGNKGDYFFTDGLSLEG